MSDPEDLIESIEEVLDNVDVEHASESQLRFALQKISDLMATAEDEEEEDEEDEDEEDEEEGVEVDEEGEEIPWK